MNIPKDQLAGILTRVGGALIDLIIVFIVAAIAMFFWGFLSGFSVSYVSDETWRGRGMLAGIVLDLIYTCITMSGKLQSTFGQRAVGIKVIRSDGSTVEFGTALVRYLVSLISSIVLKLGYFIALFTDNRRTLHDLAAGTVVVDNRYVQANSTPSTFGPKIISATVDSLNTTPTQLKADQPLEEVLDEFWGKAANEFDTSQDKSSWAKAFAFAEGNELKAKALYIRFRARSLQAEHDATRSETRSAEALNLKNEQARRSEKARSEDVWRTEEIRKVRALAHPSDYAELCAAFGDEVECKVGGLFRPDTYTIWKPGKTSIAAVCRGPSAVAAWLRLAHPYPTS